MMISQFLSRFKRSESGVMLTEFAIVLPMLLLIFGIIIESGRVFWSYQSAVSGVRDAARYLSRVVPVDICTTGVSVAGYEPALSTSVSETIGGTPAFPNSVSLVGLSASVNCISGAYRIDPVPVARVVASVQITFPFSGAMQFFGAGLSTVTTQVESQSRIFGL
jgi:hypothetical protein